MTTEPTRLRSPSLEPRAEAEFARRRRGRNWAVLIALLLLCAIFYAMAWVKMSHS